MGLTGALLFFILGSGDCGVDSWGRDRIGGWRFVVRMIDYGV